MPLSQHVATMLRIINRRYYEPLSLELFSETLDRERGYLGRLFKKEVGCSMREYLARVRVRHAAELIREGTKIEAVILEVGYRSPKRFYDAFKQEYRRDARRVPRPAARRPEFRTQETALDR